MITVVACSGYGLTATCIGVAAYQLVGLAVTQYALATRLLGIPLHHTLIRDSGPAVVSSAVLTVAFAVWRLTQALPPAATVALTAAAGFVA